MSVRGYLVDTNHVTAWEKANPTFMARLSKIDPQSLIFVSTVTIGEIEWGVRITTTSDSERRRQYRDFVARELWPRVLDVIGPTSLAYAEILERVWRKNPPAKLSQKTETHLVALGVDVNDLWMVATALQRNLTVLTQDKMPCIREVVPDVEFECWI